MTNEEKLEVLKSIEVPEGKTTAEAVVAAARNAKHPFHNEFEWDNKIAGEQYRLAQARTLIRTIYLVVRTEYAEIKAPYYIKNPDVPVGESGYCSIISLRDQEESSRAAIVREFSVAAAHLRRARSIALALGRDAKEIDDILERVVGLHYGAPPP